MTCSEIRALPVGALVEADGIFYLVYDVRLDAFTGGALPLVTVVDWAWASNMNPPHHPTQRFTTEYESPNFEMARRIA